MKLPVIRKVSIPIDKLYSLKELDLNSDSPSKDTIGKREDYAKMALLVFHPFWQLNNLKQKDSHWRMFDRERNKHFNGQKSKFWRKGFEILQDIQDKVTLKKNEASKRSYYNDNKV